MKQYNREQRKNVVTNSIVVEHAKPQGMEVGSSRLCKVVSTELSSDLTKKLRKFLERIKKEFV